MFDQRFKNIQRCYDYSYYSIEIKNQEDHEMDSRK